MRGDYPEFRDWSIPAVRLLQGVVQQDDGRVWSLLLTHWSAIDQYVARLGLQLVVDESEGFAYLKQFTDDTQPPGYDAIPKLFRSSRMSFGQTVLCVLLRDAFRRFEEEGTRDERCVIDEGELLDQWKTFFPTVGDDVRQQRELQANLRKLEEMGFVRPFGKDRPAWEVRRILKARLTVQELEHLHQQLVAVAHRPSPGATS